LKDSKLWCARWSVVADSATSSVARLLGLTIDQFASDPSKGTAAGQVAAWSQGGPETLSSISRSCVKHHPKLFCPLGTNKYTLLVGRPGLDSGTLGLKDDFSWFTETDFAAISLFCRGCRVVFVHPVHPIIIEWRVFWRVRPREC
jgi:hypothetical protein